MVKFLSSLYICSYFWETGIITHLSSCRNKMLRQGKMQSLHKIPGTNSTVAKKVVGTNSIVANKIWEPHLYVGCFCSNISNKVQWVCILSDKFKLIFFFWFWELVKGPDRYRTTVVNNDYDSINSSSSAHSVSFTLAEVNKHISCQIAKFFYMMFCLLVLLKNSRCWISTWIKLTVLILVRL